jgi:3-hydroxybutyryl-CoA dehydrogenase
LKKTSKKNSKGSIKPAKDSRNNAQNPKEVQQEPVQQEQSVDIEKSENTIEHNTATIFLTGESPLVEQYAEVCASHHYSVKLQWNIPPQKENKFLSPQISIADNILSSACVALELTNIDRDTKRNNLQKLDSILPDTTLILSSSITVSATEQASWISRKHRLIGFAALPSFVEKSLVEVAPTIYSPKETMEIVSRFFTTLGKNIEIVQDRVGLVLPRIICQIINEAAFAITEDIASPQDIDIAMKLGGRFPLGPIEWIEKIGVKQVYAILDALYRDLQEERYRIAPILKQMALTGSWWTKDET